VTIQAELRRKCSIEARRQPKKSPPWRSKPLSSASRSPRCWRGCVAWRRGWP